MRITTTPWVRDALAADPIEAMTVESITRPRPGALRLAAKGPRGPYLAIYHAPGDTSFDGRRATHARLADAVALAMGLDRRDVA